MIVKKELKMLMLLGIVLMIGLASAQANVTSIINNLMCRILQVLWAVAAGVAVVVIVVAGIKWIGSAEDAGARAQAKSTIVHAIIGLLIVMVAMAVVGWVVSGDVVPLVCP
jgi:type IV secretory pathway VirB2 component (pilin)